MIKRDLYANHIHSTPHQLTIQNNLHTFKVGFGTISDSRIILILSSRDRSVLRRFDGVSVILEMNLMQNS